MMERVDTVVGKLFIRRQEGIGFSVQVWELAFDGSMHSSSIVRSEDREHGQIQVSGGNCLLIVSVFLMRERMGKMLLGA